ncbi:hypothetical protein AgCh_005495 [Apium graveolens]
MTPASGEAAPHKPRKHKVSCLIHVDGYGFNNPIPLSPRYLQTNPGENKIGVLTTPRFLSAHSQFYYEALESRKGFGTRENCFDIVGNYSHYTNIMASASAAGDIVVDSLRFGNVTSFAKYIGVYCNERVGCRSFQKLSMRLTSTEPYDTHCLVRGYFIFDVKQRSFSSTSNFDPSLKTSHASSSPCYSDGLVPDMTVNGLSCSQQLATTNVLADQLMDKWRVIKV